MDPLLLVSLLNAGLIAIALQGCLLLYQTPAFRGVCLLLLIVLIASIINILEDQQLVSGWHLISPVFVLAYGPALYLAVKRLITGPVGYRACWHFTPIFILLPFTENAQVIIAIGTFWRIVYALLTVKLIIGFNRHLTQQRSDAKDVSLAWLGWLIGVSTCFSALDLLRLNMQPELGTQLNTLAYAANIFTFLLTLLIMVVLFIHKRTDLLTAVSTLLNDSATFPTQIVNRLEETAADYHSLFVSLDKDILEHHWYCLPRLNLNELSKLSGISTRDISRSINLVAGVSFNDYINRHRIEHIKKTLHRDNSTNLTHFAFSAGFTSKATFNHSFKKVTGMTPSAYRKHHAVGRTDLES